MNGGDYRGQVTGGPGFESLRAHHFLNNLPPFSDALNDYAVVDSEIRSAYFPSRLVTPMRPSAQVASGRDQHVAAARMVVYQGNTGLRRHLLPDGSGAEESGAAGDRHPGLWSRGDDHRRGATTLQPDSTTGAGKGARPAACVSSMTSMGMLTTNFSPELRLAPARQHKPRAGRFVPVAGR